MFLCDSSLSFYYKKNTDLGFEGSRFRVSKQTDARAGEAAEPRPGRLRHRERKAGRQPGDQASKY